MSPSTLPAILARFVRALDHQDDDAALLAVGELLLLLGPERAERVIDAVHAERRTARTAARN
jgi:hypothetical protein